MPVLERLTHRFLQGHPVEAARVLEGFEPDDLGAFLRGMPPAPVAAALAHSVPATAADCLARAAPADAARVISEFELDFRVAVLRLLEDDARERVLQTLSPDAAVPLRRLLRFPEGSIGDLMEPYVLTLPDDITAGEGVKRARRASRGVRFQIYVVDRSHVLTGVVTLHELMRAKAGDPISAVMNDEVVRLRAADGREEMLKNPYWRDFSALPVVDDDDVFLGIIRNSALLLVRDELYEAAPQERLLDTAIALGELYWMGLSGVVSGIAVTGAAGRERAAAGTAEGAGRRAAGEDGDGD